MRGVEYQMDMSCQCIQTHLFVLAGSKFAANFLKKAEELKNCSIALSYMFETFRPEQEIMEMESKRLKTDGRVQSAPHPKLKIRTITLFLPDDAHYEEASEFLRYLQARYQGCGGCKFR
jgi:hypothetical protein